MSDESELDDFLSSIGMDTKPLPPEEMFMININGNALAMYRFYIRWEILYWFDAEKNGWEMTLPKKNKETGVISRVRGTKYDWCVLKTKYYLHQKHLPYFMDGVAGIVKCDIDKVTQLLLDHEHVKPILEADEENIPHNWG